MSISQNKDNMIILTTQNIVKTKILIQKYSSFCGEVDVKLPEYIEQDSPRILSSINLLYLYIIIWMNSYGSCHKKEINKMIFPLV